MNPMPFRFRSSNEFKLNARELQRKKLELEEIIGSDTEQYNLSFEKIRKPDRVNSFYVLPPSKLVNFHMVYVHLRTRMLEKYIRTDVDTQY